MSPRVNTTCHLASQYAVHAASIYLPYVRTQYFVTVTFVVMVTVAGQLQLLQPATTSELHWLLRRTACYTIAEIFSRKSSLSLS